MRKTQIGDELLLEFERALDDDAALLRGLSDGQLQFKPEIKVFSIAEGLTHGLHTDQLLWSWVQLLMAGGRAELEPQALIGGAWGQADQSGAAIATLIENVRLIARGTLELRPEPIDLLATAPHPYFGELNAKGWIKFMTLHHGLHLRQCEAVIDAPGFPRGTSKQSLTAEEYLQPRERKTWLKPEAGGRKQEAGSKKPAAKRNRRGLRNRRVSGLSADRGGARRLASRERKRDFMGVIIGVLIVLLGVAVAVFSKRIAAWQTKLFPKNFASLEPLGCVFNSRGSLDSPWHRFDLQ